MQLEHNPMQLWPKPKNLAVKERSSIKNMTLRSRLQAYGVKSGVKGRDERHSTAPLTPLPTPTPLHALDTANVVRDVKPPNTLTPTHSTTSAWRTSSTQQL